MDLQKDFSRDMDFYLSRRWSSAKVVTEHMMQSYHMTQRIPSEFIPRPALDVQLDVQLLCMAVAWQVRCLQNSGHSFGSLRAPLGSLR